MLHQKCARNGEEVFCWHWQHGWPGNFNKKFSDRFDTKISRKYFWGRLLVPACQALRQDDGDTLFTMA